MNIVVTRNLSRRTRDRHFVPDNREVSRGGGGGGSGNRGNGRGGGRDGSIEGRRLGGVGVGM